MKNNLWSAILAYLIWACFPLYWKQLEQVPALQILSHRIVWSLVFLAMLVTIQKSWRALKEGMRRSWWLYGLAGVILGANWLLYVWGVNSGQNCFFYFSPAQCNCCWPAHRGQGLSGMKGYSPICC